jgi:adenylyltransferase/sulfurtransferase
MIDANGEEYPPLNHARYVRQMRFAPFGEEGQRKLASGRALICGCGALGTVAAVTLVRAGVGHVRIVDRDFLELSNLQRQMLFDEADAAAQLPKAVAAAARLKRINSSIEIEGIVADVSPANIEELVAGVDVIVDGTDNFETRFLLNDAALKFNIPWIYGGCLGAEGQTMTILPGETGCLRCLMPEPPPPGVMPTCETAGVLGPIVNVISSIQACEALKILSGNRADVSRSLAVIDLWTNHFRQFDMTTLREQSDCPTCQRGEYAWLTGDRVGQSLVLCGRNAVQVTPTSLELLNLDELASKLGSVGRVTQNRYLVRCAVDGLELTVFADGRAIVSGVSDPAAARAAYAKYVGN